MNKIVARIHSQDLSLRKHYGNNNQYTYHGGRKLITYPAFDDLEQSQNMYYLAHELGHHYQYMHNPYLIHIIIKLANSKHLVGLIFFPLLLWVEVGAWIGAWKVCKEEKIPRDGFIEVAIKALTTYIKSFFLNVIQMIKYVLGFYLSAVFLVRFFIVSEEMNLHQPGLLISMRNAVLTSGTSQSEMVLDIFYAFLFAWIMYSAMCLLLLLLKMIVNSPK